MYLSHRRGLLRPYRRGYYRLWWRLRARVASRANQEIGWLQTFRLIIYYQHHLRLRISPAQRRRIIDMGLQANSTLGT